jgi:hypothetical protein
MHYQCPECDREGKTKKKLRDCGCNCKIEPLLMLDPEDHKDKPEKSNSSKKTTIKKVKGWIDSVYVESIIVDGKPRFLCNDNGNMQLAEKFERDDVIYRPLEKDECGYFPYMTSFMMLDILKKNPPTKEKILNEIKVQINNFIDISERDRCLILGDLLLSYSQEWIDTLHFPFFVGETESGKSSALHLFRWLGYRCLYGEDIPNADIYNFLGVDEEATGTICEDEAQEIAVNREKIRTYKNSYSRGALKPRIVAIDSKDKRQVFYKTFCLKLFAGERIPEDKGFKERLAVVYMTEGSPKRNIKRLAVEEKEKLHLLRNKILFWKVSNIPNGLDKFDSGLKKRDQELWEDFLSITKGTKYFESCKQVVEHYTKQRHQSIWNSLEARIFRLVIERFDNTPSINFESFWYFMTEEQKELSGWLEHQTFYPNDFPKKVTRNFLSKLFEEKFQGKKFTRYETVGAKKHLKTEYVFEPKILQRLAEKYNVSMSIDSPVLGGQGGGSGSIES